MSSNLLDDINEIINGSWEKSVKSNKIMERLRGETIFIPKSYRIQKEKDPFCTIAPKECLPLHLSQLEEGTDDESVHEMIRNGVIGIKGNSFGPFYPDDYFNSKTKEKDFFKIVWILKESYIKKESYNSGDRGAHNQAAEYAAYGISEEDKTHYNVLQLGRIILETIGEIDEDELDKNVMKHICILEANHFPGLDLNKSDSKNPKVKDWLEKNRDLLQVLIRFYDPDLVIGGGDYILNYFCNDVLFNWCAAFDHNTILSEKKLESFKPFKVAGELVNYSWPKIEGSSKHSMIRTIKSNDNSPSANNKYRFWINAYHPQQPNGKNAKTLENHIRSYAQIIRQFR